MDRKLKESDENVLILPGACVTGEVTFGPGCSVWYNAVLRADGNSMTIGRETNIQDNAVLHAEKRPIVLGNRVSVGHGAILHSCTVEDECVIGMGAILLDGAVIGRHSLVAAGALVTKGTVIPAGSMVMGSPARVRRPLTQEEIEGLTENALHYLDLKETYR